MGRLLFGVTVLLATIGAAPAHRSPVPAPSPGGTTSTVAPAGTVPAPGAPTGAVPPTGAGSASGSASGECANAGSADFDGDGFNDIVVGDPFGDPADRWAGGGHLFFLRGTPQGFPKVRGTPFPRDGGLSGWVARAGHIDGDRCLDLVVANPFWAGSVTEKSSGRVTSVPGAGNVYVYWGGRDFGRTNAGRIELRAPEQRNGAHFGWSLTVTAGAVAVGAPYEDADGVPDSGAVYLYGFGGAGGRQAGEPRRITQQSPGVPGDGEAGDLFGWSLALGGLAAGPAPDLAIGAPYEDTGGQGTPVPDAGALTVLYDPGAGAATWYRGKGWNLPDLTDQVPVGERDLFGYSLAYGDNGGRGYLAAGAPYADPVGTKDAGAVQLLAGRSAGDPQPAGTLWQGAGGVADVSEDHDAFGFSLAFSGGRDLVVGAPFDGDGRHAETGAVHVLSLGGTDPATGRPLDPERLLPGSGRLIRARTPQTYDHLGWSVSGTGDGWLVIGVPDREGAGAIALAAPGAGDAPMLRPGDGNIALFDQSRHLPFQGIDFGATVAG
ncbi:hypothetical protein [Sphaerisporangium perillae]|uniref:hypothetical protein n=1 Tax=Sphaerisporangium perillae TaxID=2935860 RepID=UPI00200D22B0|nr:hypothetical protein [Sphaerisporangium perillae]